MSSEPRVALVLSGGGARGFAHIGVLQALEARNVRIDAVAGTSMGAILGALFASGQTADEIFDLADGLGWRDVIDVSLQAGLMKGDKLRSFLAAYLPERFDQLSLPFAATTTDMESGEERVLLDGSLVDAVRASSSFPGAFEPVEIDGRTLADGGIVNNLPVGAARLLGCDYVIASNASAPRRAHFDPRDQDGSWWERMVRTMRFERRSPMAEMMLRSTDVMQAILTDLQYSLHPADVRIELGMPQFRLESFRAFAAIVQAGHAEAERVLDGLANERPDALPPIAGDVGRRESDTPVDAR